MATTQETISGGTRTKYSTKETAQLIREALKQAFPSQKFSVRTSYASMTSSTSIRWTDGPTMPEVERITDQFTSRGFDGQTDSTTYHEQEFNGQRVSFSGWVHVTREYSAALLELALRRFQALRAEYGLPPANLFIKTTESLGCYSYVDGPDANKASGVNPCGYRHSFQYCSDAVQSIAYQLRPNGCRVTMKDRY